MDSALQGLLIGLAIAVLLLVFEYMMINKAVNERAKKYNRKPEFDVTDRPPHAFDAALRLRPPHRLRRGFLDDLLRQMSKPPPKRAPTT